MRALVACLYDAVGLDKVRENRHVAQVVYLHRT